MTTIQIFVKGVGGKTKVYDFNEDSKVDEIFETVAREEYSNISPDELRFLCGAKELQYGAGKCMKDYGVQNHSTIFTVLRLPGGFNPVAAARLRKKELTPLSPYISVTTSEMCVVTLDDDPYTKRAKMPCGHVIGTVAMSQYARSCLDDGKYIFNCPVPKCGSVWDFFMVRHVAALSVDELKEMESMLAENYATKAMGVQRCPGCKTFVTRKNKSDQIVRCPICSKQKMLSYNFCWSCLHQSSTNKCANVECDGKDPRIRILLQCQNTKMAYTGIEVPSIRACPGCGILINHIEGCKHMTCTCKTSFCFVCLKKVDASGYACGKYNTTCTVAPRQDKF